MRKTAIYLTAALLTWAFLPVGAAPQSNDVPVTLLAPAQQSVVPLLQDEHKKFWEAAAERKASDLAHWKELKAIVAAKPNNCCPRAVEFSWQFNAPAEKYIFVLAGGEEVRRFVTNDARISVDNLRIGTQYRWYVEAVKADGTIRRSIVNSFRTEDTPPRWIRLPDISNVRDAGGWKTADGTKRIRQGMVYRGGEFDGHQNITEEGRRIVRDELHLRTDWELRDVTEIEVGMTEYPLHDLGVRLVYRVKESTTPEGLASEIHFLATLQEYPVYVHCWGGADRTGQIIFALQALLGVSDEDLLTDYEMTSFGRWGNRSRHDGLRPFLEELDKYGNPDDSYAVKVEAYLRAGGLSQRDFDELRNLLLEKSSQ